METSHGKVSKSQRLKKKAQAKLDWAGSGDQRKSLRKPGLQLQMHGPAGAHPEVGHEDDPRA